MKKRSVVMYNMIFPIWLILTPLLWPPLAFMVGPFALLIIFVVVFGNLGVDWLVVRLAMHWQKVENAKEKAAAVLCRVCLCGFAADTIAGLALMFAPRLFSDSDWFYQNVERPAFYGNLFESVWAVLYVSAGLSMGGYGALKLAMGNPDRYKGAVSLSGVVDIMDLLNCGLYEELLDLDSIYGKEREKVKGSGDDIYFLTQKTADERKEIPRVYLAVGKDDYFAKTNQAYAQMIGQLGIDYHFDLDEGGHDWNFWNPHLKSGLEWMLNG